MPESIVRDESAFEFFREQLVKAMEHQRIATSAFTEHYLVNLLAAFMKGEAMPARERCSDPLKIISSVFLPRNSVILTPRTL